MVIAATASPGGTVLPGDVDEDDVAATMDEGVLTVRVPKAASERPRRIPIS